MSRPPVLVAVNGRSAGGKTTFAGRLAALLPQAAVLHTDDLAWFQGVLSWDDLLREGVLGPVRTGTAVSYRPPAWEERGRTGAVSVPAGLSHLVVEGVGVGRASLHDEFDVRIWVETSADVLRARERARAAAGELMSPQSEESWMAEENAHFAADQPWERADLVVDGSAPLDEPALRALFGLR